MTYRRIPVRAIEKDAADNLHARSESDRIGGKPAGGVHGAEHIVPRANQPDIDWIAGDAVVGARDHAKTGQRPLVIETLPHQRQEKISQHAVEDDQRLLRRRAPTLDLWPTVGPVTP